MNTNNKGASSPAPKEPLSSADEYNVALQLYNNEFRALGERANSFLFPQSIFVAALLLIFTNLKNAPIAFDVIALGIITIGILFCALYLRAGLLGAQAAYTWRRYMRRLEKKPQDTPWEWFRKASEDIPQKTESKSFWTQLWWSLTNKKGDLLDKLPLPNSWLFSPLIFLFVWTCAYIYIFIGYLINYRIAHYNTGLLQYYKSPLWLFIPSIVIVAILLIYSGWCVRQNWKAWHYPDNSKK